MIRRCRFFLVGLGLVFLAAGTTLWADDPKTKTETEPTEVLKIGIINMKKVFSECRKNRDGRVDLEKQRSDMQSELDKKETALKKLEQELEVLDGEEKLKKKAEFDEKRKEYTAYFKVNNKDLQYRQCKLWKSIYNEIIDEVKLSAEQEDYDIVLKVDNGPVSGNSLEEIQLRIDIRKILFYSPKVNLTDGIINILNEKYKRAKESKEKRP